jgi:hypothetical protein
MNTAAIDANRDREEAVTMWPDTEDSIIGGDLAVALGYLTPAGGVVVRPVVPVGMRDRAAGTVAFSTSLGFARKLERIARNPQVALAYHAREHGFAREPHFVLVQGDATYEAEPNPETIERTLAASTPFIGPPQTGVFWNRWMRAYYTERVLVTVRVRRVISWPDRDSSSVGEVAGSKSPLAPPPPQAPPDKGTGPRVDVNQAMRRLVSLPHVLLGYRDADGYPRIVPVEPQSSDNAGIRLSGPLPPGGRRAGLLGHGFQARLIGLETRVYTGWLSDGLYAPHTESGFKAPANKTLTLPANGFLARRGVKQARAARRSAASS